MDTGSEHQRRRRFIRIAGALGVGLLAGAFFLAGGWPVIVQQLQGHQSSRLPGPSPSPTPPRLSGPLPKGVPAIVYRRNAAPSELVAASWSGQLYSVANDPGNAATRQSPDGTRVIGAYDIYDLTTGVGTRLPGGLDRSRTWADDSDHICMVGPSGGDGSPAAIAIAKVGGRATELARVGVVNPAYGVRILACSVLSNRVVAEQVGGDGETQELWVLNATTGAVEHHRKYPAGTLVIASSDGRYLAETDAVSAVTSIRLVDNGAIVDQLSELQVAAFSTLDSWVLVMPRQPGLPIDSSVTENPSVLNLSTGQSVWQAPPPAAFAGSIIAQPGGGSLAIVLTICGDVAPGCQHKLWLIGPDGQGRELDHDVQALF